MLHRLLLGRAPDGLWWDHKNHNTLDNRRKNLRAITPSANAQNRRPREERWCRLTPQQRLERLVSGLKLLILKDL
jgi:hypothetical protein